jgi:ABC-type multidrug transport system fused ATPase/permease subunit
LHFIRLNLPPAWNLLNRNQKRSIVVLICSRVFVNILDVIGFAIVGLLAVVITTAPSLPSGELQIQFLSMLGLIDKDLKFIATFLAGMAATFFIGKSLISAQLVKISTRTLAKFEESIAKDSLSRWINSTQLEIERSSIEDTIYSYMHSLNMLVSKQLSSFITIVTECLYLVFIFVALLFYSPIMTLMVLIFFGIVSLYLQIKVLGRVKNITRMSVQGWMTSSNRITDSVSIFPVIAVNGARQTFLDRILMSRKETIEKVAEADYLVSLPRFVIESALYIGILLVSIGTLFADDSSGIAQITIFFVAATRVVPSLMPLQQAITTFQSSGSQSQPALTIVDRFKSFEKLKDGHSHLGRSKSEANVGNIRAVEVNSLGFSVNNRNLLSNVSISIAEGSFVSIVGPSGAGKSTLLEVIAGLKEPTSGNVRIFGESPSLTKTNGIEGVSYVPQKIVLFNGTLRENLLLPQKRNFFIEDEKIWELMEKLKLDLRLKKSKQGLEQIIGSGGENFSGGEMQRIGIARALLSSPRLLLLDEATSALDPLTEEIVQNIFKNFAHEITIVAVAHRLATVTKSDNIIFMKSGTIQNTGSFDNLMNASADFQEQVALLNP